MICSRHHHHHLHHPSRASFFHNCHQMICSRHHHHHLHHPSPPSSSASFCISCPHLLCHRHHRHLCICLFASSCISPCPLHHRHCHQICSLRHRLPHPPHLSPSLFQAALHLCSLPLKL